MDLSESQQSDVSNEMDHLKKMEDEHLRLQRQFRMIQTDRSHRTMGVHPLFREKDHLLRTLKKEYLDLMKDLKIARSGAHKKKDKKMKKELKRALILRKKTDQDCEGGTVLMTQLEHLIKLNNKNVLFLRSLALANKGQLDERRVQSEQRLVSTENRLETANMRFNKIQFENKKIREEIEHMLKDRALFNQAWSNMMSALTQGKKYLREVFESSSVAYDQRDEWCGKLRSLQEKANLEQTVQVQEMRDIQNAYDHEIKLYQFLARKGVRRVNKKQEEREAEEERREEEEQYLEIQRYQKILRDINEYTDNIGEKKVISNFKRLEVDNYSKYLLLCQFCAENEVLTNEMKLLRRDIVDRRDWNENKEAEIEKSIETLQRELDAQNLRTEALRTKLKEKDDLLNGTMERIAEIFKILDCSLEPFQNLLGDKEPSLRLLNLTCCLITDKIKDLIQLVYYNEHGLHKKEAIKTSRLASRLKKYTVQVDPPTVWSALPINIYVPADPCPSCIEARWLSRVSEVAEVPLDKDTVLQAVNELAAEVAYLRSDRIHMLVDCKLPRSRLILAKRYT